MPLHAQKHPLNTTAATPKARTATALWWLCWLLLALAPTLGQMHRALHGGHGAATHRVSLAPPSAPYVAEHRSADISQLFGQHSAQDCQLLDQWTWAHPPSITLAVPRLLPAPPVAVSAYQYLALQTSIVFQARAPPVPSQT